MGQKKYREPVEFEIIQAAIQGDVDSINQIIAYFQPYITTYSKASKTGNIRRAYPDAIRKSYG